MSVGFKPADKFFRRGHAFAMQHSAPRLIDDSEQQASVVFDFVDPDFGLVVGHRLSSHLFNGFGRLLQGDFGTPDQIE